MRFCVLLALACSALACSSTPDPIDAGADAGGADASPDAGTLSFACKSLTCDGVDEYCELVPVGACTIVDAGACPTGEEPCVTTGGSGCTPERTASCEPLGACTGCACLIAMEPCGAGLVSIACRLSGGTITLECPYP